jgi:imidazole glycerol phosphate synthase glutamine amidotransferase subunit
VSVVVVETGLANLASVLAGLRRAGADAVTSAAPDVISAAQRLVLPGVGAFGAGMARLREMDVVDAIAERVRSGRPTLAVCLGLQLLCRESEESPGVAGVGVVDAAVRRFREAPTVPQLGWNEVVPDAGGGLLERGYAYFANSYRVDEVPAGWRAATSEHGERFVAALERGPVLACQFHPELSGAFGLALVRRWLGGGSC